MIEGNKTLATLTCDKEGIVAGCLAAAARGQELGKILGAD